MKVLNKIEKSAPTLYKKLSNTFPYLVEHAHQYYKKIGNPTSKTLGGKALDFITTSLQEVGAFGRKTGEIIPDIWKRSAGNIAKIVKYGGYTSLLMADNYEAEGMESDLFDKMVDYEGLVDEKFYREDDSGDFTKLKQIDLPEPATQEELIEVMKEREERDKNYGMSDWLEENLGIVLQDDPSDRPPGITESNDGPPEKKYIRPAAGFSGEETQIKPKISIEFGDPNIDDVTEGILTKQGNFADNLAYGGQPDEEGMFSDSIDMTGMKGDDVDVKKIIKDAMISISSSDYHMFSIPLNVSINSGLNWGEAH